MKCNVCGRELSDGQMFCQCGNTVGQEDYSYSTASLNVNAPSSGKIILIAAIAGFVVFASIIALIVSALIRSATAMTDRSRWENYSRPAYSMTLPPGMKDSNIIDHSGNGEMQHLDTFRNSNVIVDVSVFYFTEDQKKYFNRKKIKELCVDALKKKDTTPLEHGELIYVEFPQDASGIFFGTDKIWTYDAMYISNSAFYEIEIAMPTNKRESYEEAVFAMFDSFRPKST